MADFDSERQIVALAEIKGGDQRRKTPAGLKAPWTATKREVGITVVRRVRRKGDGLARRTARWVLSNQTGISLSIFGALFLCYQFPQTQRFAVKFFALSYHNAKTGRYAIGYDDFYFMAFFFVLFTGLRSACMHHVLQPLARYLGLSGQKQVTRFAEQSYMLMYYSCYWPMGMYIYRSSPYWLDLRELWTDWPTRELDGIVKAYYLMQWSFWAQQVVVLNIEERRKDHWQMLTHHFVTIALIACSYAYHFTRVGNLILVIMDFVDLIFPLAKLAKYLGYQKICDALFGLFVTSWLVTRHVFYMMVCWSIWTDAPAVLPHACFRGPANQLQGPLPQAEGWAWLLEPFRDPQGTVCFNIHIMHGFIGYLLSLQVMMVVWSFYIVKVVVRVLNGHTVDDVRSDDEDEAEVPSKTGDALGAADQGAYRRGEDETEADDEDADEVEVERFERFAAIEQEVGVEEIDFQAWERRTGVRRTATATAGLASGVTLPGHSDRKELLNRIGCEKQID
ncbi:Sphingosine N-acyltransferase lag1 [Escovopsis weberi]|uniref:Sphingosine N-acyltransferase lag1 n=1 Tax=Escovopsis weberi TaxID=150374 RepID=A0A0M8N8M1_ESCWE|nr:Sphingosine N-acyltransferase lag1 [Escovopsis weberi]